jgi:peroxiredoxin Q/BCP
MPGPAVGDKAPAFTLPGTGDHDYSLENERGKVVVLVFYPGDNTPVCTTQLKSYTQDWDQFEAVGATVWGISPQGVQSHEDFSCKHGGFPFPLLADTSKSVGKDYGIVGPMGFYRRSVFVVDAEGAIRYAHRALSGLTYRPTTELVDAVKAAHSVPS